MSEIKNGRLGLYGAEYSKCEHRMTLGFKGLTTGPTELHRIDATDISCSTSCILNNADVGPLTNPCCVFNLNEKYNLNVKGLSIKSFMYR